MESAQPLKYRIYVHLKNGEILEGKPMELSKSELQALGEFLDGLGKESLHTIALTTEISKCYIPAREILYVEVVEDA